MLSLRTFSGRMGRAALIGTSLLLPLFAMRSASSTAYAGVGRLYLATAPHGELLLRVKEVTFDVQDIEVGAGSFAPVRFKLPSAAELEREGALEGVFILVRNVPQTISLSDGLPSGRVWIVTLAQAENLRISSSVDAAGQFELEFNLIGPGNRVLGKKTVALNVQPPIVVGATNEAESLSKRGEENTPPAAPIEAPKPQVTPSPPAPPPLSSEEETVLLKRGIEIMRQGDISGARIIFEEMASLGSQRGAFALARTYDPVFVKDTPELGIRADVELALKWYGRAAELGSDAAERRRAELAAGQ